MQETLRQIEERLDAAIAVHEKGGKGYELAKKILNNYRKMKYYDIENMTKKSQETLLNALIKEGWEVGDSDRIKESCQAADIWDCLELSNNMFYASTQLEKYLRSNKIVYESILIAMVDKAVAHLETLNGAGSKKAELLRGTYLCLENGGLEQKEIIHLLGLKKSTYYNRLEEAIEDLSRILFGAYGARADILGEAGEEQRQNK